MQTLQGKFKEVGDAIEQRQYEKALKGLLWIHDNPDPSDPSSEMFRRAYGFLALAVLAKEYEPAKTVLIDLVTKKRDSLAGGLTDEPTAADLRALEEAMRTMSS